MNAITQAFRTIALERAQHHFDNNPDARDHITIQQLNALADDAEQYYCSNIKRGFHSKASYDGMMRHIDNKLGKL